MSTRIYGRRLVTPLGELTFQVIRSKLSTSSAHDRYDEDLNDNFIMGSVSEDVDKVWQKCDNEVDVVVDLGVDEASGETEERELDLRLQRRQRRRLKDQGPESPELDSIHMEKVLEEELFPFVDADPCDSCRPISLGVLLSREGYTFQTTVAALCSSSTAGCHICGLIYERVDYITSRYFDFLDDNDCVVVALRGKDCTLELNLLFTKSNMTLNSQTVALLEEGEEANGVESLWTVTELNVYWELGI